MNYDLRELRQCVKSGDGDPARKAGRAADILRRGGSYRWVGIYEVTADEIALLGWSGPGAPASARFPKTKGLNGAAVQARSTLIVQDVRNDPRYLTTFGTTRAEMIVPLRSRETGEVVGTIDVESERVDAFRDEDRLFLESAALALASLWR